MQMAMNEAASRAFASLFLGPLVPSVNAYMVLEVSRENLVADALRELTEMTTSDLKKPLKVIFSLIRYDKALSPLLIALG